MPWFRSDGETLVGTPLAPDGSRGWLGTRRAMGCLGGPMVLWGSTLLLRLDDGRVVTVRLSGAVECRSWESWETVKADPAAVSAMDTTPRPSAEAAFGAVHYLPERIRIHGLHRENDDYVGTEARIVEVPRILRWLRAVFRASR